MESTGASARLTVKLLPQIPTTRILYTIVGGKVQYMGSGAASGAAERR